MSQSVRCTSVSIAASAFCIFFVGLGNALPSMLPGLQRSGPLYKSVQLLIADERIGADSVRLETTHRFTDTINLLEKDLEDWGNSSVSNRLQYLTDNKIFNKGSLDHCLKRHERQIARFNRELLYKYENCKRELKQTIAYVKSNVLLEMAFMRNAPGEIENVAMQCNCSSLKRTNTPESEGVILCVLSHIGDINQRLTDSADLCFNVLDDVNGMYADDGSIGSEGCADFKSLREQFNNVYDNVMICRDENQ